MKPKPVVKWAGGKARLLGEILPSVPARIGTYFEPFCGGAALFFALAAEDPRRFKHAVLADRNEELVALYRAIRDDLPGLLKELRKFKHDRDFFYEVRAWDVKRASPVKRGARLLFLNKTCFNGLWRVNSKGEFNVPFGKYKNPNFLDEDALAAASEALQGVDIKVADFADVTRAAKAGDFVYFDPPYAPVSRTAQFTSYAVDGFGPADQERLREEFLRLRNKKVAALLSNADVSDVRALYDDFSVRVVSARRSINSDIKKRGVVSEVIVSTTHPAQEARVTTRSEAKAHAIPKRAAMR
ncbi:MAG: Dam family site-specific DNA-(adenine-N6)-methyltransferase [Polyangiaceae bacterium]